MYRDTLPHRSRAGKTVFVIWRLSDSLPVRAEMEVSLRKAQQRYWFDHVIRNRTKLDRVRAFHLF